MSNGLTHSIGGVNFVEINPSQSRISLGAFKLSQTYDIKRFHPSGATGNFVVHNGRNGGKIICTNLYKGALSAVLAAVESDMAAWEDTAVTIILSSGTSILRCLLDPGGMSQKMEPRATGRGGAGGDDCTAIYQAMFSVDS